MIRPLYPLTGLWLKPQFEKPAEAGSSSPHPDIPALKDRSITLRASLLKQAPAMIKGSVTCNSSKFQLSPTPSGAGPIRE